MSNRKPNSNLRVQKELNDCLTSFQLYRGGQFFCFLEFSFTSSLNDILPKPLAALRHDHCRTEDQRWERNEYHPYYRKEVGQTKDRTRETLFSSGESRLGRAQINSKDHTQPRNETIDFPVISILIFFSEESKNCRSEIKLHALRTLILVYSCRQGKNRTERSSTC